MSGNSQTLTIYDLITTKTSKVSNNLNVKISSSFIKDQLGAKDFLYLKVRLKLANANGAAYFDNNELGNYEYSYSHNDYLTSGNYEKNIPIHHDQVYSNQGSYPTKLGVYVVLLELGYSETTATGDTYNGIMGLPTNNDIAEYIYWNKNSSIEDFDINGSNMKVGQSATLLSTYDIAQSDYPMTYYWTVKTKDKYNEIKSVIQDQSSGKTNKITVDLAEDPDLKELIVENKIVLDKDENHYAYFSRTLDIKGWADDLNITLAKSKKVMCSNDQITITSSVDLNEIPNYIEYSWEVSPDLTVVSSNAISITLKTSNAQSGLKNVRLNYSGLDPIGTDVWVGKPNISTPSFVTVQPYSHNYLSVSYNYADYNTQGVDINSVNYTSNPAVEKITGKYVNSVSYSVYGGGYGNITSEISNDCGCTTKSTTVYVNSTGGYPYAMSNPVDQELVITNDTSENQSTSYTTSSLNENEDVNAYDSNSVVYVELYNSKYKLIYSGTYSGENLIIDTSPLKNDIYFLHFSKNEVTKKQQIIVQH